MSHFFAMLSILLFPIHHTCVEHCKTCLNPPQGCVTSCEIELTALFYKLRDKQFITEAENEEGSCKK